MLIEDTVSEIFLRNVGYCCGASIF